MPMLGKASDPLLTEEAYARAIGKAVIPSPGSCPDPDLYIQQCMYTYTKWNPNAPAGFVGDRQRFYNDWAEHIWLPWEKAYHRWKEWIEGYLVWRARQQQLLNAGNNGTQLGPREFTFTYGTHFEDDKQAQRAMERAVERLTRYYKNEIIEFHAVGEFTKAGRAHVHGWYHLKGGKKITDKNFKRAYPPWNPKKKLGRGFEGGHHATIERVSDFHGYAEKHLEEAWMVVNITNNADDSPRSQAPSRVLEVVNVPVYEGGEDASGGEVSGSPSSQSSGGDREEGSAEEY